MKLTIQIFLLLAAAVMLLGAIAEKKEKDKYIYAGIAAVCITGLILTVLIP